MSFYLGERVSQDVEKFGRINQMRQLGNVRSGPVGKRINLRRPPEFANKTVR